MQVEHLRDTWLMYQREHHCSIDRMLCWPQLRNGFLSAARQVVGNEDEGQILWSLVSLRKKKTLPRTER
ncbi:MAG: hypothetical protein SH850_20275 [Planctomycetaceae bacterium]|nr:hypothetical protein [Planctomycetaceae bacterium]